MLALLGIYEQRQISVLAMLVFNRTTIVTDIVLPK